MRGAFVIALSAIALSAQAQIYKCTSTEGKVNFTDSPCPTEQQSKAIESVPPTGLDKMRIDLERNRVEREQRQAEYQAKEREDEHKERIVYVSRTMHRGLRIGMTQQQVEALPQWRNSVESNVTKTAHGTREQRVFRSDYDNEYDFMYLYFENGILTVIQD